MMPRLGPRAPRGEDGFTLMEVAIVLVVMAILMAITIPIVSTVLQASSRVNATYSNVDEQLVLSTNLQRLLRAAVAPGPSYDGAAPTNPPVTPFVPGSIGPTSVTFFANTGTADGPVKVAASCTATPSNATACAVPTSTFTVTITPARPGTCPFMTGTLSRHCTWTTGRTRTPVSLPGVRNGSTSPLFVFAYGAAPSLGAPLTTTTVCSSAGSGYPKNCSGSDAATFSASQCFTSTTEAHPFSKCPAGEIDEISYDLLLNGNASPVNGGLQAQDATGIFVLSASSMLYQPEVG